MAECDSQPCLNGGTCVEDSSMGYICLCNRQFSGRHCEIQLTEREFFIQQHVRASYFFNATWNQLVAERGPNTDGDYWVGLERLHTLTRDDKCSLRIDMTVVTGLEVWAEYSRFIVGAESTDFILSVAGYTGNAGNAMFAHDGMRFSTWDRQNDLDPNNNVALIRGGAWWYTTGCFACLNSAPDIYFLWSTFDFPPVTYYLEKVTMKLNCYVIEQCSDQPCRNGGTCIDQEPAGYICLCDRPFSGRDCEIQLAEREFLVQQHVGASPFFNATWNELLVERGSPASDYWIGLERLHALTRDDKCSLRIDMNVVGGSTLWTEYSTFILRAESTDYSLNVSGHSGSVGDAMFAHSGMRFSTRDRPNDLDPNNNVALIRGGAWWYTNSCFACLNSAPEMYFFWSTPFPPATFYLERVTMKMICYVADVTNEPADDTGYASHNIVASDKSGIGL